MVMISISNVSKSYKGGFEALKKVNLRIQQGELFALLGPNGAGKTTLISIICGLSRATSGAIQVGGFDIVSDYRQTRQLIGLVPQEISLSIFETVWDAVSFTRGLFGCSPNPDYIERLLKDLALWDKKDNLLMTLSGGMKRRVMIAKALSHEPKVLFLDEPTAGVDVELRQEMWKVVHRLRESGVTIILTTHYIEEAEDMADRIGVIHHGEIILVEEKDKLMKNLGTKQIEICLQEPDTVDVEAFKDFELKFDKSEMILTYDPREKPTEVEDFFAKLTQQGISYTDVKSRHSSLEEIFVKLVRDA